MSSKIIAGTTSGTALNMSADTSGILEIQTGSTPTTAITVDGSQNVGIGTSSITSGIKLQVVGNSLIPLTNSYHCYTFDYGMGTPDSGGLQLFTANADVMRFGQRSSGTFTERMRIDSDGNLLVGTTTSPTNGKFSCNKTSGGNYWQFGADAGSSYVVYNSSNAGVYLASGSTAWAANSDERLKTELKPFENAVEKISSIRAGTGRYLKDDESVSRSFLIAQDVQKVLPEAVDVQENEEKTLGLRYQDVIPLLVASIKEQQVMIEELKAKVVALEAK